MPPFQLRDQLVKSHPEVMLDVTESVLSSGHVATRVSSRHAPVTMLLFIFIIFGECTLQLILILLQQYPRVCCGHRKKTPRDQP
jgi:hypothetical protein